MGHWGLMWRDRGRYWPWGSEWLFCFGGLVWEGMVISLAFVIRRFVDVEMDMTVVRTYKEFMARQIPTCSFALAFIVAGLGQLDRI